MAIAAGEYHSLALKNDGTIVAWGDNSQGQSSVPPDLSGVAAISGGGGHSLALRTDGSVVAWGANWNGQCDLPTTTLNALGIAAGSRHSLVLVDDGAFVPRLFRPAWRGNRFSTLAQTLNRKNYSLEYRNSLPETNWTALPAVKGNGAIKILSDTEATSAQRFYRIRQY